MIALCTNPYKDKDLLITDKISKQLRDNGFDTKIFEVFSDNQKDILNYIDDISLIVVIGGDGTILSVSDTIIGYSTPILGVNLGTVGFMASVEPNQLDLIVEAAKGNYTLSKRMMLTAQLIRDEKVIFEDTCLNDVVLHGSGDIISLKTFADNSCVSSFMGDGLIISTPTGSTGYSMSAGGPIIEPDAEAIVLTPICAHSLTARACVLVADRTIVVHTERIHDRLAYISVDGKDSAHLNTGDIVKVYKSDNYINMAIIEGNNFFDTVFRKLL